MDLPHAVVLLKFYSMLTVVITFLTVTLYLGPIKGYGNMFGGTSLYTHLVGPILAFLSLVYLERGDHITFGEGLIGLIPFLAYCWVYLRQVLLISKRDKEGNIIKGWEDFYRFNRNGNWHIVGAIILCAAFVVMMLLRILYN